MPNTQFRWTTTVANLMNESGMVNGEVDVLQGYSAAGDGGGGSLYFDTTLAAKETITAATNASPIAITTSAAHGFSTGQRVWIGGVGGNTAANGIWTVTVTSTTAFTLNTSTGNGAYTSGGAVGDGGQTLPSNSATAGTWRRLF